MIEDSSPFDVAVIGAGMMGSAAARHLAVMGARVALIGPPEPTAKTAHKGVFASHYDQARIFRKLASDEDWSRLSQASIDRYADLAKAGGRAFFRSVGTLMAGPETGLGRAFIRNTREIAQDCQIPHEELRGTALKTRFPYFDFPDGILALYERDSGGWINPRETISAQIEAGQRLGVTLCRQEVHKLTEGRDRVVITCSDGSEIYADRAIVACGAFSNAEGLLPEPLPLTVYARTVAFVELPDEEVERLCDMPSVVYVPPDHSDGPYILPPVQYGDGKTYLKIGGEPDDVALETVDEIKAWFQGHGNEQVAEVLRGELVKLMPGLTYNSVSSDSCVTSFTPKGRPLIYQQTKRLIALTGGNGAAAKCGDEIGRLGAKLALECRIDDENYAGDFRP